MRKIFAIFTALLLLSCSTNHDEVIVRVKQNPTTKITKEQALKNLYGELKIIDAETRAGGEARKVKSIKSLEGAKTRSGNALDNDLLYIVEFEEGQGSAVLAADTRLDPVIAVLDSDVMTAEDFASDDMDDISAYMASMIGEYVEITSSEPPFTWIPAPDDEYDTTIYCNAATMLRTKWGQGDPYNRKCVEVYGNRAVAGCWPVALAQFIYYMQPSPFITIGNFIFGMGNFRSLEYGNIPTPLAESSVANFVYAIGQEIDAQYLDGETNATTTDATSFIRDIGYSSATAISYSSSAVFSKLNINQPMLIRGHCPEGGHAWVIDGGYHYTVTGLRYNYDGGADLATLEYKKVHCNYGWDGECDGYYTEGLFDTSEINNDVDLGAGDIVFDGSYNFTQNIKIINY